MKSTVITHMLKDILISYYHKRVDFTSLVTEAHPQSSKIFSFYVFHQEVTLTTRSDAATYIAAKHLSTMNYYLTAFLNLSD